MQGLEALDYKELGYTVPWEHQDLVAQEDHVGQEQHHGVHVEQADPMDLLDPVTRVAHRWKQEVFQQFMINYTPKMFKFKRSDGF